MNILQKTNYCLKPAIERENRRYKIICVLDVEERGCHPAIIVKFVKKLSVLKACLRNILKENFPVERHCLYVIVINV